MLNVTAQSNAAGAKSYFAKEANYYSEGQEIVGRWGGKGAVLLGLFGDVEQSAFNDLCDNRDPRTGGRLTRITGDNRRVGFDFTWSAPKSVSVMHALTGDERIVEAFRSSIEGTMTDMENEMQTRVRKGRQDCDRTTGNWCYAEFIHLTSRPVEGVTCPQLHAHCFVQNATYDAMENQWKAGQFGRIKSDAYYWQAVQQARFARSLQDLGYAVRRTKDAFEIEGVPDSVIRKFSLRSSVIDRVAEKLGITDPKRKAKLAATTREAKNDSVPYPQLVAEWKEWLTADERDAISAVGAAANGGALMAPVSHGPHAAFAVEHMFERASVADERRILALALRHGLGEVTPEGMQSELEGMHLLRREENGRTWITTPDILDEERRMLAFAAQGKATCHPFAAPGSIRWKDERLDDGQRKAVEHVLTSSDRAMLLRGIAGTGKTTLTREAVAQMEERGVRVAMLAPSALASRGVLREEGFDEADTLARFLCDERMQEKAKNGVVWLDEAGLVGSRSMTQLFDLADRLNARVVLSGDKRQLAPVERGSPLRLLEDLAGLKVAEITDIKRQKGEYREAVKLLAKGDAAAGFDRLDALGWIKLMPEENAYAPISRDFVAARQRGESALIVCPTHLEGEKISEEVRRQLKESGALGEEERQFTRLVPLQWTNPQKADVGGYSGDEILQFHHKAGRFKAGDRKNAQDVLADMSPKLARNFAAFRPDTIRFSKGDVIKITANGMTKDGKHRLNNGSIHTVKGFTAQGDIELNNGWIVAKDFGHIRHGYVNTDWVQGKTVDRVLIAISQRSHPAVRSNGFYVELSRARKSATLYTDSKEELRTAVQRTDARRSATELLASTQTHWLKRMRRIMARAQDWVKEQTRVAALEAAMQRARTAQHRSLAYER